MKKCIFYFILSGFLFSCNSKSETKKEEGASVTPEAPAEEDDPVAAANAICDCMVQAYQLPKGEEHETAFQKCQVQSYDDYQKFKVDEEKKTLFNEALDNCTIGEKLIEARDKYLAQ